MSASSTEPKAADTLGEAAWQRAIDAAVLLAVDPIHLGGAVIRAQTGPVRDRWLRDHRALCPAGSPHLKVPLQAPIERLVGGLDLSRTLASGKPSLLSGLLKAANDGWIVLPMSERLTSINRAVIGQCLDQGAFRLERDGFEARIETRFAVLALDEGVDDEAVHPALSERLAFHLELHPISLRDLDRPSRFVRPIADAREALGDVVIGDDAIGAIVAACTKLGIVSIRAPIFALHAARASAALEGRDQVESDDLALGAALVLAHRARRMPINEEESPEPEPPDNEPPANEPPDNKADDHQNDELRLPDDLIVDAVKSVLPADLLASLAQATKDRVSTASDGKAGAFQSSWLRGRPIGNRRAKPGGGKRLDVIATLTAAAPWQPLRRKQASADKRVHVRLSDLRYRRFHERRGTVMIFAVDASGSSALGRLAEAKGAIELVLARCYVRRDEVALIAFRGQDAELLLPPTRSLARAKKQLAGMAGGGGTPLASGIDAAHRLALSVASKGSTPSVILMTDGRANIAFDHSQDRQRAHADALQAARSLAGVGVKSIVIDTSPRPRAMAKELADAMSAPLVALPFADARRLEKAVNREIGG